jgi:hypothetical protein
MNRLVAAAAFLASTSSALAADRPNIIFINLYGQPGQKDLTRGIKAELAPLKAAMRDEDQFASEQPPNGVDGTVAKLRGK